MIVGGSTTFAKYVRAYWREFIAVLGIVVFVEVVNDFVPLDHTVLSLAALALVITALSIFLVFRMNEAYGRWWEARTLWGGIVNDSRSFARQVITLIDRDAHPDAIRRLVYRQIAWVNALRLSLRRQDRLGELGPFLEPDELEAARNDVNVPTQLLQRQAEDLTRLSGIGALDPVARLPIEQTLSQLCNHQGGCERIKTTAFPDRVVFFTRTAVWALAIIIPFSVIDPSNKFDPIDFILVPLFMLAFVAIGNHAAELKDPFENRVNDTAMTALCRTIEIDLRQQLGEADLPDPIEPVDGVLP